MIVGGSTTILWDNFLARRTNKIWSQWRLKKRRKRLEKVGVGGREDNKEAEAEGEQKPDGAYGGDTKGASERSESRERKQEGRSSSVGIVMQGTGQGELQRRMSDSGGIAAVPLTDGTTVRNLADEEHKVGGVDGANGSTTVGKERMKGEKAKMELSTDMQSHAISLRVGMIVTVIFLGM